MDVSLTPSVYLDGSVHSTGILLAASSLFLAAIACHGSDGVVVIVIV